MEEFLAYSIWGNKDVGWSVKNTIIRSRGMITLWNPSPFVVLFNFIDQVFLGIQLIWKDHLIYIVNVYSSCHVSNKRKI